MTEYTLVRELSKVYDALYDKLDGASGTLIHNKGLRSPSLRTLEAYTFRGGAGVNFRNTLYTPDNI